VALRRIVRLLRLADREAETAHGLSAAQLFVLHTLGSSPASSLAELAARTLTDQSSVSTVVARLVAAKLVVRKAAATDRRRAELRLTAAGARVVRGSPRVPQALIADAVRAMPTAARRGLVRSLDGLVEAIGARELAPHMLFEDEPRRRPRGRR
jgi:DNA-binding MarR family transcriptional regulator